MSDDDDGGGDEPKSSSNDTEQNKLSESMDSKLTVKEHELSRTLPGKPLPSERDITQTKGKGDSSSRRLKFDLDSTPNTDLQSKSSSTGADIDSKTSVDKNSTYTSDGETADHKTLSKPQGITNGLHSKAADTDLYRTDSQHHERKEDRVLVEINGKFELISVSDLQSMGYPLPASYDMDYYGVSGKIAGTRAIVIAAYSFSFTTDFLQMKPNLSLKTTMGGPVVQPRHMVLGLNLQVVMGEARQGLGALITVTAETGTYHRTDHRMD